MSVCLIPETYVWLGGRQALCEIFHKVGDLAPQSVPGKRMNILTRKLYKYHLNNRWKRGRSIIMQIKVKRHGCFRDILLT
jgi:hypothetical protein